MNRVPPGRLEPVPSIVQYLRVAVVAALIRVLLICAPLPVLLRFLGSSVQSRSSVDETEVARIVAAVRNVSATRFYIVGKNCLVRSMLLYYFLIRLGVKEVQLKVGVMRAGSSLVGHAWVSVAGRPYPDETATSPEFEEIYSLEAK